MRLTVAALLCVSVVAAVADELKLDRFEKDIAKFEAADAEHPPAKGQVLFVGSSSIRLWKLADSFPKLDAINRGFGGSTLPEVLHYFDRIVKPYEPRSIVLYAGDNDMHHLKHTPRQVLANFKAFVDRVRKDVSKSASIHYIAIKPSRARWALWPAMAEANGLIAEYAKQTEGVHFADIAAPMLAASPEGEPPPAELFVKDGLHLSEAGYAMWAKVIGPMLGAEVGDSVGASR